MPNDLDAGPRPVDEALRESEERYRAFIANSTEGIWRFEIETPIPTHLSVDEQIEAYYQGGYLAECNDAMARMYGYERAEEIVGARLGDLLVRSNPDNIAHLRALILSGYRLANADSTELDIEGRQKYFSNNVTGIIENGLLYRIWGMQRDITDRKRAEQRLAILYGITRIVAEKASTDNVAPDILRLICENLEWGIGALWLVDKEAGLIHCLEFWHEPRINVTDFESVSRGA
jgi:PAS domain S-box-containing protein